MLSALETILNITTGSQYNVNFTYIHILPYMYALSLGSGGTNPAFAEIHRMSGPGQI